MWRNIPWIRLLLAVILLAATFISAGRAVSDKLQVAPAFTAVICLIAACILLGTTLIRQASRPMTGMIDRIYFGSHRDDESPPLNLRHPRAYRAGRIEGTREMVVRPNYLVVYRETETIVTILRVLHTARQWP